MPDIQTTEYSATQLVSSIKHKLSDAISFSKENSGTHKIHHHSASTNTKDPFRYERGDGTNALLDPTSPEFQRLKNSIESMVTKYEFDQDSNRYLSV